MRRNGYKVVKQVAADNALRLLNLLTAQQCLSIYDARRNKRLATTLIDFAKGF